MVEGGIDSAAGCMRSMLAIVQQLRGIERVQGLQDSHVLLKRPGNNCDRGIFMDICRGSAEGRIHDGFDDRYDSRTTGSVVDRL